MIEYQVIIHHTNGQDEHSSRLGYSADHVMDLLHKEYTDAGFTVIPPLSDHRFMAVNVFTSEGQKAFALDELKITADDYSGRQDLCNIIKQRLDDEDSPTPIYEYFHLVG